MGALLVLGLIAVALLGRARWEVATTTLTTTSHATSELSGELRVAQVTDFHNIPRYAQVREIVALVRDSDPHVIALTGDLINTSNRTAASIFELMGSPTQPNTYIFENQATISAGTGSYALRTGVFPAGSILKIVNKGYIRGKGGNGGPYNAAGSSGGVALYIDFACELDNGSGFMFGGGGGGGGAQTYAIGYQYAIIFP